MVFAVQETETTSVLSPDASFRVWVRPMGQSWKLCVEGHDHAGWLSQKLAENGFNSTTVQDAGNGRFTFTCLTSTPRERNCVERLLIRWPELQLQLSPDTVHQVSPFSFRENLGSPMGESVQVSPVEITSFRVWIRPMGLSWKLKAEGITGATWLYRELLHRGLDCTTPADEAGAGLFVFRCQSTTPQQKNYVWNLLKKLPQVTLQNAPA